MHFQGGSLPRVSYYLALVISNYMEEQKSLKQIADELMQKKGNVRGEVIRVGGDYIRSKKGEEGILNLEGKLKELGYPFHLANIKPLSWYPEGLSVLIIVIAKEIFNWGKDDIFDWGNCAPKTSFLNRMFMKYFISLEKILQESPRYWKAHFDFGELEPGKVDEKKKTAVIRIKGYDFHPLVCSYHAGYFLRILSFSVNSKNTTIKEVKCIYRGDSYHEYLMQWR